MIYKDFKRPSKLDESVNLSNPVTQFCHQAYFVGVLSLHYDFSDRSFINFTELLVEQKRLKVYMKVVYLQSNNDESNVSRTYVLPHMSRIKLSMQG